MSAYKKAIGLLGGTFDPIHFGHLRMALELLTAFHLSQIHFIPCYEPVHRKQPIATPEARLAMVKEAIIDQKQFVANDIEICRQGPSYTVHTILALRQQYPDTPLCILLGIDAFLGFSSWYQYLDILQNAHLIIAHRPNYTLPTEGIIADLLKVHLVHDSHYVHQQLGGGILLQPITALEISASGIRKQIMSGLNPRYLLPKAVYQYIQQHNIYKTQLV